MGACRAFEDESQFSLAIFLAEHPYGLGAITRNRLSKEWTDFDWMPWNTHPVVRYQLCSWSVLRSLIPEWTDCFSKIRTSLFV